MNLLGSTGVGGSRWQGLKWIILAVVIAWVLEIIDIIMPGNPLDGLGIYPRSFPGGLLGIVFCPWLHGGLKHLFGNTLTFIPLAMIVMASERGRFLWVTMMLVILSGIGVWLFGSSGVHIGASGLIYGYFGLIVGRAYRTRSVVWIITGVLVGLLYGWMLLGLVPKEGISWEGHLFGLIAGIWMSGWARNTTNIEDVFLKRDE